MKSKISRKIYKILGFLANLPGFILWPLIFLFFFAICLHRLDPDFGWHLAAGQNILAHGIPSRDIFTFSAPNFAWINVEWLNDVIFAKIQALGGYFSLSAIFAALWTLPLILASYDFSRKSSIKSSRISAPIIFAGALLFSAFAGVRTEVWMILFIALIFVILASSRKFLRLFLPAIFLIWAQIHGSWPAGLALIGWWAIFFEHGFREKFKLFALIFLCFFITFLNPYGTNELFVIAQTGLDPALKNTISEWMPIWQNVPKSAAYLLLSLFALILFFFFTDFSVKSSRKTSKISRKKSAKSVNSAPNSAQISKNSAQISAENSAQKSFIFRIFRDPLWPFLVAAISSVRYLPLFVLMSFRRMDQIFRENFPKFLKRKPTFFAKISSGATFAILILVFAFSFANSGFLLGKSIDVENQPLEKAVEFFRENPNSCAGNLFNSYNFGGFLIWRLPEKKIFIDGRMPSWTKNGAIFGPTFFADYEKMAENPDFLREIFAKYDISCAAIDKNPRTDRPFLAEIPKLPGWKIALDAPGFAIFTKN